MKNLLKVEIKASKILEYIKEGQDCKIEVSKQGEACVLPFEAYGYGDVVLTQVFAGHENREFESDKAFIDWVKYIYDNVELEATGGQIINIKIK